MVNRTKARKLTFCLSLVQLKIFSIFVFFKFCNIHISQRLMVVQTVGVKSLENASSTLMKLSLGRKLRTLAEVTRYELVESTSVTRSK